MPSVSVFVVYPLVWLNQNLDIFFSLLILSRITKIITNSLFILLQLDMSAGDYKNASSIYDFSVKDTHGNDVSLEKYKGKVVLVVNIASKCGLTKNNYQKLTDLKEKYGERGLTILNFPCNQFGSQMPEADGEAMVCHLRDSKADIGEVFAKVCRLLSFCDC